MHRIRPSDRRHAVILGVLALAPILLILGIFATPGHAQAGPRATDPIEDANPSNYSCKGHVEKGTPVPGDDDQQVEYHFACSGPITGFSIQPQIGNTGYGDSATVFDATGLTPVTSDSFTCAGALPGFGFSCTGSSKWAWNRVVGQFSIATKLCAEPRVDPILTVTYATATVSNGAAKITQYIAGPFDLHRPRGCPKSRYDGRVRITGSGNPVAYPNGPAYPVKKKATKKKSRRR